MNKGFTLFIAIVIMGTLLLIAAGITNLAVKQSFLSSSGRESQAAFYAADTGMDCALYWDVSNNGGDDSAFSTTNPTSPIICNGKSIPFSPVVDLATGIGTSTISFDYTPDNPFCVTVTIVKTPIGQNINTKIESRGYNTCDPNNPRRVERAVRATY